MDHVAVRVRQDLYFDMPWSGDEFFDKNGSVTKCSRALTATAFKCLVHFFGTGYRAHAAATAARRCLEHDRIAEIACQLRGFTRRLQRCRAARHYRDVERLRQGTRSDLVTK